MKNIMVILILLLLLSIGICSICIIGNIIYNMLGLNPIPTQIELEQRFTDIAVGQIKNNNVLEKDRGEWWHGTCSEHSYASYEVYLFGERGTKNSRAWIIEYRITESNEWVVFYSGILDSSLEEIFVKSNPKCLPEGFKFD
jgi:hypothetical protein